MIKTLEEEGVQQMEETKEDERDDIELVKLDLDGIEEECGKKGKGYVSRRHIKLLQEVIIRTNAHESLWIDPDLQTGSKRKYSEEELRRGRKTNKQRIAMVGVRRI